MCLLYGILRIFLFKKAYVFMKTNLVFTFLGYHIVQLIQPMTMCLPLYQQHLQKHWNAMHLFVQNEKW